MISRNMFFPIMSLSNLVKHLPNVVKHVTNMLKVLNLSEHVLKLKHVPKKGPETVKVFSGAFIQFSNPVFISQIGYVSPL